MIISRMGLRNVLIPRKIRASDNHCSEECRFWNGFEMDAYCIEMDAYCTLLGVERIVPLSKSENGWERSQKCLEAEEKAKEGFE
ncbi:MAG: hypothetical protein EOM51_11865 [Clostridia bacterium]|nr:hypothetical protein [Clostridia bacterium]